MFKNINCLLLDPLLKEQILQEKEYFNMIQEYSKSDGGIVGNAVKKATNSVLSVIGEWIKSGVIIICNYAGGLCLIVGSLGILGMMADSDNKIGCKKYVIGSLLVYVGIKCILLMII